MAPPKGNPDWAEDWKEQFILRISADGRSLRSVVEDGDIPGHTYLYGEFERDTAFAEQYARASNERADGIFDEILEIADKTSSDPQDRRVKIDARKWVLGKMRPKKYGEKVQNEHTSPDGSMSPVSDDKLARSIAFLLQKAAKDK